MSQLLQFIEVDSNNSSIFWNGILFSSHIYLSAQTFDAFRNSLRDFMVKKSPAVFFRHIRPTSEQIWGGILQTLQSLLPIPVSNISLSCTMVKLQDIGRSYSNFRGAITILPPTLFSSSVRKKERSNGHLSKRCIHVMLVAELTYGCFAFTSRLPLELSRFRGKIWAQRILVFI